MTAQNRNQLHSNVTGLSQQQLRMPMTYNNLHASGMSADAFRHIINMNLNIGPRANFGNPSVAATPAPTTAQPIPPTPLPPTPASILGQGEAFGSSSKAKSNKRGPEDIEEGVAVAVPVQRRGKKVRRAEKAVVGDEMDMEAEKED
ncbi:hypothetical protein HDU76_010337 [Blyttiomyces sp. JEL0837]|nr:hypothetical protein HDU76_010337 [Blyttiomyces sp. JEL0837]